MKALLSSVFPRVYPLAPPFFRAHIRSRLYLNPPDEKISAIMVISVISGRNQRNHNNFFRPTPVTIWLPFGIYSVYFRNLVSKFAPYQFPKTSASCLPSEQSTIEISGLISAISAINEICGRFQCMFGAYLVHIRPADPQTTGKNSKISRKDRDPMRKIFPYSILNLFFLHF